MEQCLSLPAKLYCFRSQGSTGPIRAADAHKLGRLSDTVLNLDLAKNQINSNGTGAYVSLFANAAAAKRFVAAHYMDQGQMSRMVICEINTSQLGATTLYRTSQFASRMGVVGSRPLPDYLGRGSIPAEALSQVR